MSDTMLRNVTPNDQWIVDEETYQVLGLQQGSIETIFLTTDSHAAIAAALANYGLVIEPGTTLFVGPTNPSAQMSVGDVWIDSSVA